MDVSADFIVAAYRSAFAEVRFTGPTDDSGKGIFSDATVGPCDGENSDFFPAGNAESVKLPPVAVTVTEAGPCSSSGHIW